MRKRVRAYKYVDDGITVEKVSFENAEEVPSAGDGLPTRVKRAVPMQNAFRCTSAKARSKGMKVNNLKTNLLTISLAQSYRPVAVILYEDGSELRSELGGKLKLCTWVNVRRQTVCPGPR